MYKCETCGETAQSYAAALRHSKGKEIPEDGALRASGEYNSNGWENPYIRHVLVLSPSSPHRTHT